VRSLLAHELTHVEQQIGGLDRRARPIKSATLMRATADEALGLKAPPKESELTEAEAFIAQYRGFLGFDTEKLADDLRNLALSSAENIDFILSVLDAVDPFDRDDIAYYFMEPLNDTDQLIHLANSETWRALFERLRQEMKWKGAAWTRVDVETAGEDNQIKTLDTVLDAFKDEPTIEGAVTTALIGEPHPPTDVEPNAPPYPEGLRSKDFLSSTGARLWADLEEAWITAETAPSYSSQLLGSVQDVLVPRLALDPVFSAGKSTFKDLAYFAAALVDARSILEKYQYDDPGNLRALLEPSFSLLGQYAQAIDAASPASIEEYVEAFADVDPLIAIYARVFPSEPTPDILDDHMRARLALALADNSLPQEIIEQAKELPFVALVLVPLMTYVLLWLIPEPTSNVLATALTAFLLTMFSLPALAQFAKAWLGFYRACKSAATEDELRSAANILIEIDATLIIQILIMIIGWVIGNALRKGSEPNAAEQKTTQHKTDQIQTFSARPREGGLSETNITQIEALPKTIDEIDATQTRVTQNLPEGKYIARSTPDGGLAIYDTDGNLHLLQEPGGKIVFPSEEFGEDVIAAGLWDQFLIGLRSTGSGRAASSTASEEAPQRQLPGPTTGGLMLGTTVDEASFREIITVRHVLNSPAGFGLGQPGEILIRDLWGGFSVVINPNTFLAVWFDQATWRTFLDQYPPEYRPTTRSRQVDSLSWDGESAWVFANEVKSGAPFLRTNAGENVQNFVGLDANTRPQILWDAALRDYTYYRQQPPYYTPRWHFIGVTPTPDLLQALRDRGIPYNIY
jgi:hypothetical protein